MCRPMRLDIIDPPPNAGPDGASLTPPRESLELSSARAGLASTADQPPYNLVQLRVGDVLCVYVGCRDV